MKQTIENRIDEGKVLLKGRRFPGSIIEAIQDKRLRKDIASKIFHSPIKFKDLKESEKKWRTALLQVQFAFTDYLSALDRYRATGIVVLLLGFITLVTAIIGLNDNLIFGIISMIQGGMIVFISYKHKLLVKTLELVTIGLIVALVLEVVLLGIPEEYIQFISNNIFAGANPRSTITYRSGSLIVLANASTPLAYIVFRATVCLVFVYHYYIRLKYWKKKAELEADF